MAAVKHTKNELRAQREALRRFERFLPMLQLKKQQLQMELRHAEQQEESKRAQIAGLVDSVKPWAGLAALLPRDFSLTRVKAVHTDTSNIAGIAIPVFKGVDFERADLDLHATPSWYDDLQQAIESLAAARAEQAVLEEQSRLLAAELRATSQRVNLFEKVKIPECRENIRIIRIFLGDEQAAGVARAKFAKKMASEAEATPAGTENAA